MGVWHRMDVDYGESTTRGDLMHAEAARKEPGELNHAPVQETD